MVRIEARIYVESNSLDVEQMNTRIGLQCDRSWNKGDRRRGKTDTFSTNSWMITESIDYAKDHSPEENAVDQTIHDLARRLDDHQESFRGVASNSISGLLVGITAETSPPICLSPETITFISSLGLGVEFDIILA